MNKQRISEMEYKHIRLWPVARRIDEVEGIELQPIDDKWLILNPTREMATLWNPRSDQRVRLGTDHIREYMTDLGNSDGIFQLKSQLFLFRKQLPRLEPLTRKH
jgi:hypothetical protein